MSFSVKTSGHIQDTDRTKEQVADIEDKIEEAAKVFIGTLERVGATGVVARWEYSQTGRADQQIKAEPANPEKEKKEST